MAQLNPYLSFRDNAREVMEFYRSVFGGELTVTTFGEFQAAHDPDEADKVMHSTLVAPDGMVLMASDTPSRMEYTDSVSSVSLSISGSSEEAATLRGYWDALAEGAEVTMPLDTAPWGDAFGMLTDRFGVNWMVNIAGAAA